LRTKFTWIYILLFTSIMLKVCLESFLLVNFVGSFQKWLLEWYNTIEIWAQLTHKGFILLSTQNQPYYQVFSSDTMVESLKRRSLERYKSNSHIKNWHHFQLKIFKTRSLWISFAQLSHFYSMKFRFILEF